MIGFEAMSPSKPRLIDQTRGGASGLPTRPAVDKGKVNPPKSLGAENGCWPNSLTSFYRSKPQHKCLKHLRPQGRATTSHDAKHRKLELFFGCDRHTPLAAGAGAQTLSSGRCQSLDALTDVAHTPPTFPVDTNCNNRNKKRNEGGPI